MATFFDKYISTVKQADTIKYTGYVTGIHGSTIISNGPRSVIGEMCTVYIPLRNKKILAEVVALEGKEVHLMAYEDIQGIEIGCEVVASGNVLQVPVGEELLGRVLNAVGKPIDGKGEINPKKKYPAIQDAPNSTTRKPNDKRILTGVKAIDSMLTIAKGQRMGIFAGSGVGKSTLLSTIARNTSADVNVIALVGERGREVNDFLEKHLGEEGLKKSVVVVSTGDQSPVARMRASYVATAIAEYFRDEGKDVMMIFDNITRYAKAYQEIALSTGEPPARSGYPSSVFENIPKLLERTGTNDKGSITAFYAVLVDGDDFNEPITDCVRGVLDGHILLTRQLVAKQHYPAIDIQLSISRLGDDVTGPKTLEAVRKVKRWIALYASQEDMIMAGVYVQGSSPDVDEAIAKHAAIEEFVTQPKFKGIPIHETLKQLSELTGIEIPESEYTDQPQLEEESEQ